MGKGDLKTKRGKIARGSSGVTRQKKKNNVEPKVDSPKKVTKKKSTTKATKKTTAKKTTKKSVEKKK